MNTPRTIRAVAIAVSAAWTTVLYMSGIELPTSAQHIVANIPTVLVVLTIAFDLWLWKLPLVNRLHSRPRIGGTWSTVITPHSDSHIPEGGNTGPIAAETIIEQTFWTLVVTMQTGESESVSRAEDLAPAGSSRTRKVLTFTYTNTPQVAFQDRSPIHVGATMLTLTGSRPDKMTGVYWTGRLTIGDLVLTRAE